MKISSALLIPIFFAGCASVPSTQLSSSANSESVELTCSRPVEDPAVISLVTLLANQDKYEGKAVQVVGYYTSGFEHTAIYLHQEDLVHMIRLNSFWVEGGVPESLENHYISVQGIFTTKTHGHSGKWPGTICGAVNAFKWGPG